jgi:hypothetical protein
MLELIVGSALAVLGLVYVLAPLMRGARHSGAAIPARPADEASAIEALREIEFDQATGKLSPDDYATLRATYAPLALAELEAREAGAVHDAAEQLIARMKSRQLACAHCGPRPEGDALFCSDCGRYLSSVCLRCGAAIESPHSRFCGECGSALAA